MDTTPSRPAGLTEVEPLFPRVSFLDRAPTLHLAIRTLTSSHLGQVLPLSFFFFSHDPDTFKDSGAVCATPLGLG